MNFAGSDLRPSVPPVDDLFLAYLAPLDSSGRRESHGQDFPRTAERSCTYIEGRAGLHPSRMLQPLVHDQFPPHYWHEHDRGPQEHRRAPRASARPPPSWRQRRSARGKSYIFTRSITSTQLLGSVQRFKFLAILWNYQGLSIVASDKGLHNMSQALLDACVDISMPHRKPPLQLGS